MADISNQQNTGVSSPIPEQKNEHPLESITNSVDSTTTGVLTMFEGGEGNFATDSEFAEDHPDNQGTNLTTGSLAETATFGLQMGPQGGGLNTAMSNLTLGGSVNPGNQMTAPNNTNQMPSRIQQQQGNFMSQAPQNPPLFNPGMLAETAQGGSDNPYDLPTYVTSGQFKSLILGEIKPFNVNGGRGNHYMLMRQVASPDGTAPAKTRCPAIFVEGQIDVNLSRNSSKTLARGYYDLRIILDPGVGEYAQAINNHVDYLISAIQERNFEHIQPFYTSGSDWMGSFRLFETSKPKEGDLQQSQLGGSTAGQNRLEIYCASVDDQGNVTTSKSNMEFLKSYKGRARLVVVPSVITAAANKLKVVFRINSLVLYPGSTVRIAGITVSSANKTVFTPENVTDAEANKLLSTASKFKEAGISAELLELAIDYALHQYTTNPGFFAQMKQSKSAGIGMMQQNYQQPYQAQIPNQQQNYQPQAGLMQSNQPRAYQPGQPYTPPPGYPQGNVQVPGQNNNLQMGNQRGGFAPGIQGSHGFGAQQPLALGPQGAVQTLAPKPSPIKGNYMNQQMPSGMQNQPSLAVNVPQQGYQQQGYAPQQGYVPQQSYAPQQGYNPQQGYAPQQYPHY